MALFQVIFNALLTGNSKNTYDVHIINAHLSVSSTIMYSLSVIILHKLYLLQDCKSGNYYSQKSKIYSLSRSFNT